MFDRLIIRAANAINANASQKDVIEMLLEEQVSTGTAFLIYQAGKLLASDREDSYNQSAPSSITFFPEI